MLQKYEVWTKFMLLMTRGKLWDILNAVMNIRTYMRVFDQLRVVSFSRMFQHDFDKVKNF
jgi:hypothetical protein